jgi:hypothetical protein
MVLIAIVVLHSWNLNEYALTPATRRPWRHS